MTPDAALFDMDGLLLDSERLSMQSFFETSRRHGLDEQPELFHRVIGSNEQALVAILREALGDRLDVAAFRSDWLSLYHDVVHQEPVPLMAGVVELLDWLKEQGIKRAVATSSATSLAHSKLSRSGILDYFDVLIGGDQVQQSKPDPEIYIKASQALGVAPATSIGLEDSSNGVRSAVAAGLYVIQVPDLVPPSAELLELGHEVCSDLHEVLALLKQPSRD